VREAGHRPDDGGVLRLVAHALDERAVDLETVHRQTLQIRERGVAGAEVVDGQAHADRLEGVQPVEHPRVVAHQDGLADLELQATRVEPGLTHDGGDFLGERLPLELARREIDADDERGDPGGLRLPGPRLAARLAQDPPAHGQDQARLFRQADEVGGEQLAAPAVIPADQRLDLDWTDIPQCNHRLVAEAQLLARSRSAEIGLQVQAVAGGDAQAGLVELVPRAALRLGLVHGQIRVVEHLLRLHGSAAGEGDPDARRDQDVASLHDERALDLRGDPLGQRGGGVEIGGVLQQQRELVSAQARDGVLRAQARGQAMADFHQKPVADLLAERVVQDLETVQIEEEHRQVGAGPLRAGQGVGEAVHEEGPVGQPGQGVAEGLADELVQPARKLVDLLRLLLDGGEHAREGAHEGADLIFAGRLRRQFRALLVAELRGARQGGGDVPDDEGAAGHEERGEGEERRDAHRGRHTHERAQELAHRGVKRVGQQEQRDHRAEGEGEDHLAPDPLAGEGHLTIDRGLAHSCLPGGFPRRCEIEQERCHGIERLSG
jgi:hypothetical protein